MKYSIEDTTLTGIADALRRKHGETKIVECELETKISKTPNATGFDTFEGSYGPHKIEIITIVGAKKIKVKITYDIGKAAFAPDAIRIAEGSYPDGVLTPNDAIFEVSSTSGMKELEINGDTVTIHLISSSGGKNLLGYYAECTGYGDVEISNIFKPIQMAQAIDDIVVGDIIPDEAFVISGVAAYRFAYNGWNWFINEYGNKITTETIKSSNFMFNSCILQTIPFDINYDPDSFYSVNNMFADCNNLEKPPKLNNLQPGNTANLFRNCSRLRNISDEFASSWNWGYLESQTSAYDGNQSQMFYYCRSLRSIPMNIIKSGNPYVAYSYSYFPYGFNECSTLNELINLPIPYTKSTWTSNAFTSTFSGCSRVKNITFAMQEDGAPYVVKWKSQTIDLSSNVGHAYSTDYIIGYNSGITSDKCVRTDEQYQALKDDPDWYCLTAHLQYSRYNHDSAVATINSLPDTSAYLVSAGGTNTIKFKGASGSATDGGAINTLTEEEIAVATAKGWTCTFV